MYERKRIVQPARCPQCQGRMTRFTNGQGRGWTRCTSCGAQIPESLDIVEAKDEKGECGTDEIDRRSA